MNRAPGTRPALFVDRDGTIIVERRYLADPDGVELIEGAAAALRAFARAGYALIVVTNQSGIARGYYTEADYVAVTRRLEDLLAAEGITLDGVYHCPHHPSISGPCSCRKPGTALFEQAAAEHELDLAGSVYVGDRLRDTEAAHHFGGRALLVLTGHGQGEPDDPRTPSVADLYAAAAAVLQLDTPQGRE